MKPILFNTEMVRAILDGRKTITRRIIKPQPKLYIGNWSLAGRTPYQIWTDGCGNSLKLAYQPGDILYVRETWQKIFETEYDKDAEGYCVDIRQLISNFDNMPKVCAGISTEESCKVMKPRNKFYVYKASNIKFANPQDSLRWRPSIFMPKEAARIFLRVTDVRAQRLQDIDKYWSNYDKEGMRNPKTENISIAMQEKFISIWNSTIKKSDLPLCSWNANPWVWVIEFERTVRPDV